MRKSDNHPQRRPSAYRRGYTKRWAAAAKRFLHENPLCSACRKAGRVTQATEVDHIVPHRGDLELFWEPTNWAPLCKPCHSAKTLSEQYGKPVVRQGCDTGGVPLDPNHHWNTHAQSQR
jgi:5-methylcytosine-specific restriction enzyme A